MNLPTVFNVQRFEAFNMIHLQHHLQISESFKFQALSIPRINNPELGFIGEVTPAPQYTELNNNIAYVIPTNPGIAPAFNPDASQFQINEAIRLHGLSANECQTFRNVLTALRNMMANSIEAKYIAALRHPMKYDNSNAELR